MGDQIGYARVSTKDQDVAAQVEALRRDGCTKVFAETISGASSARPQFNAMMDYVRPGDTVVVVRLDRLGRSTVNMIESMERLRVMGVTIRSLAEGIDTSSPHGRMVFGVLASIAELERQAIIARTHAGLAHARAMGRKGGRPPALSPDQADAAKRLRSQGMSLREIAKVLQVSPATIHRVTAANRPGEG